jgi:hypothetical protein
MEIVRDAVEDICADPNITAGFFPTTGKSAARGASQNS